MILQCSSRPRSSQGQGYIKVKTTQDQGYSHFEVKVILESNGNVFQVLSQSERLAFVRMLIVTGILHHFSHFPCNWSMWYVTIP